MNSETLNIVVKAVLTIAIALVTGVVIPWIRNKIGADKFAKLEEYTDLAVRTAEMIFTIEEWKEKKEYVLEYVSGKAKEIGLDMSAEDINVLIEGIVNEVKRG